MSKIFFYTAFVILFSSSAALAQNEEDQLPMIAEDTVFISPVTEEEDELFNEANPAALRISSRKADSALVADLRKDEDLSYVRSAPAKKREPRSSWLNDLAGNAWFKNLLWAIIIIAFVAIVIAFLYRSNADIFRKKVRQESDHFDDGGAGDNIFDINYDTEIRNAVDAGKFPLAVRLLYLQTLKNLSVGGLIDYRQERTNGDYIFQLFSSPYYKTFFSLTRHYEYVWYGKFPVSGQAFQTMQTEFAEFNRRLPS